MIYLPPDYTLKEQKPTIETTSGYVTPIVIEAEDGQIYQWWVKTYPHIHGGTWAEKRFYHELAPQMETAPVPQTHAITLTFLMDEVQAIEIKTLQDLESVLTQLAQFHRHWWAHDYLTNLQSAQGGPLVFGHFTNETTLQKYIGRAPLERAIPEIQQVLAKWIPLVTTRVKLGHLTIIHGDLHTGNLGRSGDKIVFLDWETYKQGIGLYDVFYLLLNIRKPELEKPALDYYLEQVNYPAHLIQQDIQLACLANLFPPFLWNNSYVLNLALEMCQRWDAFSLLG